MTMTTTFSSLESRRKKSRGKYWSPCKGQSQISRETRGDLMIVFRVYHAVGVNTVTRGKVHTTEEIVVKYGESLGTARKLWDGEIVISAHHKYGRKACWKEASYTGKIPAAVQADRKILPALFALMREKWAGQTLWCAPTDPRRRRIYEKALNRMGTILEQGEATFSFTL